VSTFDEAYNKYYADKKTSTKKKADADKAEVKDDYDKYYADAKDSVKKKAASDYKKMTGKEDTVLTGKKKKDSDSDNNVGSANGDKGLGIAFGGQNSAQIIRDVLKKFILMADVKNKQTADSTLTSLMYYYDTIANETIDNTKLFDLMIPEDAEMQNYIGDSDNTHIFNVDEAMMADPPQYMGYTGSISSMIRDLSNAPYNEIFWTFESTPTGTTQEATNVATGSTQSGNIAKLNYRMTPFEQKDWEALEYVRVDNSDILAVQLDANDQEQYSIFKLTSTWAQQSMDNFSKVPPITDDGSELEARYGYKTMEIQTEYFDNGDNNAGDSVGDDEAKDASATQNNQTSGTTAAKNYPSYDAFMAYFAMDKKGADPTKIKFDIDPAYGGNEMYTKVMTVLKSGDSRSSQIVQIQTLADQYAAASVVNYKVSNTAIQQVVNDYSYKKSLPKSTWVAMALPAKENPFGVSGFQTQGNLYYALSTNKKMQDNQDQAASDIVNLSQGRIGSAQAEALVEKYLKNGNSISASDYNNILNTIDHATINSNVANISDKTDLNAIYEKYQQRLFNWYADNDKFYSGSIKVVGSFGYEYGKKLYWYDTRRGDTTLWEFYIESVSHDFSFSSGWTTTVGVTRGLKIAYIGDPLRFQMYFGHYAYFTGGFFGESNLAYLIEKAKENEAKNSSSSSDDSDANATGPNTGGTAAMKKAVKIAKDLYSKYPTPKSIYTQDSRRSTDLTKANPPAGDCSSFIAWVYNAAGYTINGGLPGYTGSQVNASNLDHIGERGSDKDSVYSKLKNGDIVFLDPDGEANGHVVMYIGNGYCIGMNGPNPPAGINRFALKDGGYWWGIFNGCVRRPKG